MFNIPGIMTTLKMDIREFQQNVKLAIQEVGSIRKSLNDAVKETTSIGAAMDKAGATTTRAVNEAAKATAGFQQRMVSLAPAVTRVAQEATKATVSVQSFGTRARASLAGVAAAAQAAGASFRSGFSRVGDGALGFSIMGAAMTGFSAVTLKTAASVQESENLFEVSMGAMAESTRAWSEEVSAATGTADFEVRKMVGTFNVMLDSMGFADEASASMSKNLTMLADDMASFYNLPVDEAFTKLSAGLSGETEPLKRLGILIDETSVKAYAMANGIGEVGRELTNGEKIVARYGLIMQNTTAAQGDLARTADSVTNQWRRAQGSLKMLSAELGQQLLPTAQKVLLLFNDIVPAVLAWTRANPDLASSIMAVATAGGVTLTAMAAIGFVAPSVISAFKGIAVMAGVAWAAISAGPVVAGVAIAAIGFSAYTLYSSFVEWFPAMGKKVTDFANTVADALSGAIGWFSKTATAVLGLDSQLNPLVQTARAVKAAFTKEVDGPLGPEMSIAEGLKRGVPEALSVIGEWVSGAVDTTIEAAKAKYGEGKIAEAAEKAMTYAPPNLEEIIATMTNAMDATGGAASKAAEKVREAGESLFRSLRKDVDLLASATESLNELKAAGHLNDDTLNLLGTDFWRRFGDDATGQIDAAIAGMQAMGGEMGTLANAMRAAQEQARIDELKPQGIALDLELNPASAAIEKLKLDLDSLAAAEKLTEENAILMGKALWDSVGEIDSGQLDILLQKIRELGGEMGGKVASGVETMQTNAIAEDFDQIMQRVDPVNSALASIRDELETIQQVDITAGQGSLFGEDVYKTLSELGFNTVENMKQAIGVDLPDVIEDGMNKAGRIAEKGKRDLMMDSVIQNIGQLGSSLSSVGGRFKALGAIIQGIPSVLGAVGSAMNLFQKISAIAATGVRLAWESALGIFGLILEIIYQIVNAIMMFAGASKKGQQELTGMAKVMDEIKEASNQWIDSISEALLDFAKEGKAAWGELVEQIFDDIFKIAAAELLVKPIVNFGGSMLGFAKGGAFDGGRVVPFAKGGHVTEGPEFFPMAYGKTGVRGEAGPEGILPLERMANGDLGVQANMSRGDDRTIINIHDNRQHGEAVQVRESRTGDGRKQLDIFIADALGRLARSGDLDGIMGSRYGLQGRPA